MLHVIAYKETAHKQVGVICHTPYRPEVVHTVCNMYHNNRHNYTPYTAYTHIYSYDAYYSMT
jgi:hypothetical protein